MDGEENRDNDMNAEEDYGGKPEYKEGEDLPIGPRFANTENGPSEKDYMEMRDEETGTSLL